MNYLKGIGMLAATALTALIPLFTGNDAINPTEWVNFAIMMAGAVGVFVATDFPAGVWAYCKPIIAAVTAGLVVASSAIIGGITTPEWFQIGVAVLGALGVLGLKNSPNGVPSD